MERFGHVRISFRRRRLLARSVLSLFAPLLGLVVHRLLCRCVIILPLLVPSCFDPFRRFP